MSVEGLPQRIDTDSQRRVFFGLSVSSLAQWPDSLSLGFDFFAVLVVADGTTETTEELGEWARRALAQGLVYSCSWGPGCETVHDVVDWEELARHNYDTTGPIVMTTWHEGETLDEAMNFFMVSAVPDKPFPLDSTAWLVVEVGTFGALSGAKHLVAERLQARA
jgi:hypothetical protein